MSIAKVPNDAGSNWEALDIFLFSNGQHTIPPRKYHLKSEELDRWEDTVKRIAHLQYRNTKSMIDLYTTDGVKLTTPIEITNNSTYVAVPHQDMFIPAGYNEYLLKASRSREKRQSKIGVSNDTNATLPEIVKQTCNEISNLDVSENKTNSNDLTKTSEKKQLVPQSTNDPAHKINKKSFLLPFAKKNSPRVPHIAVVKTSLKTKENPLMKKNLKVNMERTNSKDPIPITNNNSSLKSKGKEFSKNTSLAKSNSRKIDSNKFEVSNKIINKSIISDENNITTDNPVIDDMICDKELIVVKKPDSLSTVINNGISFLSKPVATSSEIATTLPRLDEKEMSKEETLMNDNQTNTEKSNTQNLIIYNLQSDANHKIQNINESDKIIYTNTLGYQEHTENSNINNDIQDTNQFIAVVDETDVIDLNLKIILRKCDDTVKAHTDNNELHYTTGKNRKSDVIKECTEENSKIIVVQCSCCHHDDFHEILHTSRLSSSPSEKIYFMLVPYRESNKQILRCTCVQEGTRLSEDNDLTRHSIVNPVTKVNADTSLIKVADKQDKENGTERELKINDVDEPQMQSLSRNNPNENSNVDSELHDKYFLNIDGHIQTNLNYVQSNIVEPNEDTESLILRKNASNMTKQFIDSTTQTEWSSLLLEAKRHEDGHYSFHLPPLSVLKYYF